MKFKLAKNSLFALLLRAPWWVSMLLVGLVVMASFALLPVAYVGYGAMGGFPFLVIAVVVAWRQWHAPNPARVSETLARVTTMPWRDFAAAVEQAYVAQGYAVKRLNGTAADFELEKAGQVTLLSCKRWKAASLGLEVLRELAVANGAPAALDGQAETTEQGPDHRVCISLGQVSDKARAFAQEQGITLMSAEALAVLLMPGKNR